MTLDNSIEKIFTLLGATKTELKMSKVRDIINSIQREELELQKKYTIEQVINIVSNYYEVDILKNTRIMEIAQPRQLCMYICRVYLGYSLHRIGRSFNRDHTSVIHSVKKVKNMLDIGDELGEELHRLLIIAKIPVDSKITVPFFANEQKIKPQPIYSNRSPMGIATEII